MHQPLYIFDLDGTLALTEHRQHLVQGVCPACAGAKLVVVPMGNQDDGLAACDYCSGTGKVKPNWSAFFAACVHDQPNLPVIDTLHMLARAGAQILIWSGRSDEVQEQTIAWLNSNVGLPNIHVRMRPANDHRPDEELKLGWLAELSAIDRRRLVAIFDDRNKVVRMWRALGVACFQVAPGDF